MSTLFGILLSITALLLIIVVLIQRGRGGGLAGALGGGGGQSAFGTKAGDLFTKITVGLAAFWILLCIVTLKTLSASSSKFSSADQTAPAQTGEGITTPPAGAEKSGSTTTPSGAEKTNGKAPPAPTAQAGPSKSATPPAPATGK